MSFSKNLYQKILPQINIEKAINGIERNDLLPPRPDDKVSGELGKRFSEHLTRNIDKGIYDPIPGYSITVPKSRLTTRPATLLSLPDRVVFEAITEALRPRIDKFLLGESIVFWPRGTECPKRWEEFEDSVIKPDFKYVARTDIAGFYESMDHNRLADVIVRATGYRDLANALVSFLERIMGSTRGLPQGSISSDSLATLYLAELDFVMIRNDFQYFRHGDDIRIGTKTYDEGCHALRTLEGTLRNLGLLLNVEKTRVLHSDTYSKNVAAHKEMFTGAKERIVKDWVHLLRDDEDALMKAIEDAGMDQLGWDLFYHGRVNLEDAIEQLRPSLQPSEIEVAKKLFQVVVAGQPGEDDALSKEDFHQCLVWSLIRLSAGHSDAAIPYFADLIKSYPEKGEVLCSYLSALTSKPSAANAVAHQIEIALSLENAEWETAWMVRVLRRVPTQASTNTLNSLKSLLDSPHNRWLGSVEVAKLMAVRGELDPDSLLRLWDSCPYVLRADLVEAAALMAKSAQWAKAFVASTRSDPIHEVVIRHALNNN